MKKVLVLGGTQFFGKKLVNRLLENNIDVTISTRGKTADPFGSNVERIELDRSDLASYKKVFESGYYDVVFDQTCYSPLEAKAAFEALKGKIGQYVFTSTMAVYDFGTELKELSFQPEAYSIHLIKPREQYFGLKGYQEAKRLAEAYLFQYADIPVAALRFSLVIGEDDYTRRFQGHIKKLKNEETIGIHNPDLRYSFISSDDAAGMLYHAGANKLEGSYNAAFEESISLKELIQLMEKATGKKANLTTEISSENLSPYSMGDSLAISPEKAQNTGYMFKKLYPFLENLSDYYAHKE
ncbi:NAD-dependent epimerase/dehydratase family protein [Metabacillus sp. RGM 3146]|uniref:NAD-dependent epimerase/dehydratase family protein n=1 Tax=Metabacillus sp. RGM 3146 TaxID=3401092 RepID=UPI003B9CB874